MSKFIRDNPNRRLSHAGVAIGDFALDPRPSSRGRQAVRFGDGVALSILGMVAGANSYRQMHEFIRIHLQRLNGAFGLRLPYSPSYTGLRLSIQGLSSDAKCNTPADLISARLFRTLRSVAMRFYAHPSGDERDQIAILRAAGRSMGAIARALGRGDNHHLQGAAAERTPLGRVFPASRRRSLSVAQAA